MNEATVAARIGARRTTMRNMTLSIPHQLTRAEARQRVEQLVTQLKHQHGNLLGRAEETWTGDTLSFRAAPMGMSVSGQLFVEDQAVRVEVALPWALAMLAGNMRQSIEQEGRKLLAQR